jgi:hypothetical protein
MDLSKYYRNLNDKSIDFKDAIEKQVWTAAMNTEKKVSIPVDDKKNVEFVREKLTNLGLSTDVSSQLIHANVPGGHKIISLVKGYFPKIDKMNINNQLFVTYINSVKNSIAKAEQLNEVERRCCKYMDRLYDDINNAKEDKWISMMYKDAETWELVSRELVKIPNLKFRVISRAGDSCCGDLEHVLVWNWDGKSPEIYKEDLPKTYGYTFESRP